MKRILPVVATLLLVACSSGLDRRLDGSSEQKFETSLTAMRKSAAPADVAALDEALLVLAVTDVSIGYEGGIVGALKKLSIAKSPEQLADRLMPLVDGKTGREIIVAGQARRKAEATRQLAGVESETARLTKLRDEKAATRGMLEPIKVLEPTLRFNSVGPEKMSVMDFKVRNGTDKGLSFLYLRGTVAESAGGKVLYSDDIKYKLSDEPLLPGNTKLLRLPYAGRDKWNAPEIWGRDNLVFSIEVVNADDLQGQKLSAAFTFKDAERLEQLAATKRTLQQMLAGK
jgi:hypothetical protein